MGHFSLSLTKKLGFTLVELLIAVAVIGLLASLVVQNFTNARIRSADTNIKGSVRGYRQAMELYNAQYKTYFVYDRSAGSSCVANQPNSAIEGYKLQGAGSSCVGLNGASEGGMTRQNSSELPNYKQKSIAQVLAESGFISSVQTFPDVKDYTSRNVVKNSTGTEIMKDFVLTLCSSDGREAKSVASATNYGIYAQIQLPQSSETKRASNLCGAPGTVGAWAITNTF